MIWAIGFSKTGTLSLFVALRQLGYRPQHHDPQFVRTLARRFRTVDALICIDPFAFPVLDELFPGGKFIYTERDEATWLESMAYHYNVKHHDIQRTGPAYAFWRYKIFGAIHPTARQFLDARARMESLLADHFRHAPHRLLRLNICNGEGWPQLCAFLEKPVPDEPFPRRNVREETN
ncbi:MAG: hypothetical protein QOF78_1837, partial [Phycisphaerales bacterium]|nr:hypothetical protein [Phycisphaerales bacterium]